MRLIAYITPQADCAAVRDRLRSLPGITAVGMRSGRYWHPGDCPEGGYQHVWAPDYPGIRAVYAAAGISALECPEPTEPLHIDELTTLPSADVVTIVCHGKFAAEELAEVGTVGTVIAVNYSGHLLADPPTYLVANDGIVGQVVGAPGLVHCVRRSHIPTLPAGPWYALDRVGVSTGMYSTRCALRLAQLALSAKRIQLIGHDCVPGAGAIPGSSSWGAAHMASCKREVAADLRDLAAAGMAIDHVGWDPKARAITHADYRA